MGNEDKCGSLQLFVFLGALVAGTACSLTSKIMLSMKSVGITGEVENFSFPLFQTFGMFIGMTAALFMHFLVVRFKIPFPGYVHQKTKGEYIGIDGQPAEQPNEIPNWMYYLLIFPSIFDLAATALCMFGLRYVQVSIYQMLRGSAIIFVAILKQFVLKDKLHSFMWVGIFWNVISIVLVGLTAMLSGSSGSAEGGDASTTEAANPLFGVMLILCGAFVQSLQYAFEEKVMTVSDDMCAIPPLILIGMEGLWGTLLCVFVLYPVSYYAPGADHGSIENPFNTYTMIVNSSEIRQMFVVYFFAILSYNILGCLVTFTLNSVWHAILDNFRPVTVWGTDLFIFYFLTTSFGESWTVYSWIQVLGMCVLLYGTAVYNAPNAGSVRLLGKWYDCFLDFSADYKELEEEAEEAEEALSALPQGLRREGSLAGTPSKQHHHYVQMSPLLLSPAQRRRQQEQTLLREARRADSLERMDYRSTSYGSEAAGPIRSTIRSNSGIGSGVSSAAAVPPSKVLKTELTQLNGGNGGGGRKGGIAENNNKGGGYGGV